MLVEHDEVVEHSHHRPLGKDGRLLVDRHARRAVGTVHFQNAALLLGACRLGGEHRNEQRARRRESSQIPLHLRVPPLAFAGSPAAWRLGTPAKPAVVPCHATPICWALVAGPAPPQDDPPPPPRAPPRTSPRHRYSPRSPL